MVVATQNPIEMEGTYPLPEAQRDRFMARISMGYPDKDSEIEMLETHQATSPLGRGHCRGHRGRRGCHDRHRPAGVTSPQAVKEYTVAVGRATRDSAMLRLGASPRSMLQLLRPRRPRRRWTAGISSCRTTSLPLPSRCWRTGSSWTARPPARARPRRASSAASCARLPVSRERLTPKQAQLRQPDRPRGRPRPQAASQDRCRGTAGQPPPTPLQLRGWGLLAAGVVSLLCAQIMGRRDLLAPRGPADCPAARFAGGHQVGQATVPGISRVQPLHGGDTASVTTVRLAVARTGPGRQGHHGGAPAATVR